MKELAKETIPCTNPDCFNGLIAPEGADDAMDCPTCKGDGFLYKEDDEKDD